MLIGNHKANIPPEVMDRFFKHCELDYCKSLNHFSPNFPLYPLLFVCKEWHAIVERRLYASVSLGSDRAATDRNERRMEIIGKDVCKRFCDTVRDNPRLASLVRELRLGHSTKDFDLAEQCSTFV